MALKSFDIKIDGQQYMFGTVPGITLATVSLEPGTQDKVDTIVIESLHKGIGRPLPKGILRYKEAREADLSYPYYMLPGYTKQTVDSFADVSSGLVRPMFSAFAPQAGDFRRVISAHKVYSFDPQDLVGGPLTSEQTGGPFNGSSFAYGDLLIVGTCADVSLLVVPGSTYNVFGTSVGGGHGVGMGVSGRSVAFWISDGGDGQGSETLVYAPYAGFAFKGSTPGYPYTFTSSAGYYEFPDAKHSGVFVGQVSWMAMVGSILMIFTPQGRIITANESGLLNFHGDVGGMGDQYFGRGAKHFLNGVMFPSVNGLWHFDPTSLTLRPLSANVAQVSDEERLRGEYSAVGSIGQYGFAASRYKDAGGHTHSQGYMLVQYADGVAFHDIIPETANDVIISDFLPFYVTADQRTALFYLEWNEVTESVALKWVPLRLPTDRNQTGTHITTSAQVDLQPLVGPTQFLGQEDSQSSKKLWHGVRGRFHKGTGGAATFSLANVTSDGQVLTAPTVSADGSFSIQFDQAIIGRQIDTMTLKIDNPVYDTRLEFPLEVDFSWNPDSADSFTVHLLVSGEVDGRVAAHWQDGPWGTTKHLLGLQGQIVVAQFPEGDLWNVLVESVKIADSPGPDATGGTAREAVLMIRRVP